MSLQPFSPALRAYAGVDSEAPTVPPRPRGRAFGAEGADTRFWWTLVLAPTGGLMLGVLAGLLVALA